MEFPTSGKILDLSQLANLRARWAAEGQTVVFTNGCFDLLHLGHVDYLEKARALGTRLIVALNTDTSVSRLKGSLRPLQPLESRARVMAALAFVDAVTAFEEDTPLETILALRPDVLVKGKDYSIESIVGAKEVLGWGGRVETVELVPGYSTTNIEKKIRQGA